MNNREYFKSKLVKYINLLVYCLNNVLYFGIIVLDIFKRINYEYLLIGFKRCRVKKR